MAIGPGVYDGACTVARESTKAEGAAVIVYHGEFGNGFSVQGPFEFIASLPDVLRQVADEIEGRKQ